MLTLTLKRIAFRPTYTVGRMFVRGEHICDTIEDCDRCLRDDMSLEEIQQRKQYGVTAIPTGRYKVTLDTVSPKFKSYSWAQFCGGRLPRLHDVKGFDGVLIHVGNTAEDSLGCIIVGQNKEAGKVINSAVTFRRLYDSVLLPAWKAGEEIYLEIV